jgi:hypothetical protein
MFMKRRVLTETLISLEEARRSIPWPVSILSVARWARTGCRGVKLESARVGGRIVTSREALERFLEGLNREEPSGAPAAAVVA